MLIPKRKAAKRAKPTGAGPRAGAAAYPASSRSKSICAASRRRWFVALALIAPLLGLGALEWGLRLGGFGYPTHFFLKTRQGNQPVWIENARFGWRFFPRPLARAPRPIVLPAEKPPDTCRIFVFGESAALGDPEPAYGLTRVLEVLLKGHFPDKKFEVVNVAMTAINSNVILPIARDCARRQGDVWVIYMGNNEVVGPFGAGTVFGTRVPNLALLRASLALKKTRVGQFLARAVTRLRLGRSAPQMWEGMEMFLQQQIRFDDARLEPVYEHFERNLRDILRAARQCGAKVVVSTVASNLKDCAPFASMHRPDLTAAERAAWDPLYRAGSQFVAAGKFDAALAPLKQAEKMDASYADLQFQLAECDQATGQFAEAARRFETARDLDALRFRCDSRLNQIIRRMTARRTGEDIYLLDAEHEFALGSPRGLTGDEFFVDHVHFGFEGNYLLAGLIGQEIVNALPLREGVVKRAWPTMTDCARRLALSGWDRYQLVDTMRGRLEKPPFTRQLNHVATLDGLLAQLQKWRPFVQPGALTAWNEVYRQALAVSPNDWVLHAQFAKLLEHFGAIGPAAEQWRQVAARVPQYAIAHFQLGRLLDRGEDRTEAKRQLLEALRWWPDFPQALDSLGIVLAHEKQFAGAGRQFARALELKPDYVEAQINWAITLAAAGQPVAALAHYSNAVSLQPDNAEAHFKLGVALEQQGRNQPAAAQFREALRLDPTNQAARESLTRLQPALQKNSPR